MRFEKVDDATLLSYIHAGEEGAMNELLRRYGLYSWKQAYLFLNEHANCGITIEDFQQVAFASIISALRRYEGDGISFYAYWKRVANNEMTVYFIENSYTAKGWSFAGFSLDEDNEFITYSLAERKGEDDMRITSNLLKEEIGLYFEETLRKFKKDIDLIIINLFVEGYNFESIQKETKCPIRHIYYVIDRFQRIFSDLLKKRNYN